eukprot:CAMPEP_0197654126 /NCGR_PEP_ID=MMETSP1338-20131121/38666_1 /TAXON_ID=43686 ORGANISM="Pelagodinium beii, Strain RCC1491" /NCGR_SAMPLE_ID=MMETSP1338 /ASSEMBLY_ACC=CAM_ASM_000754 /LENGTH=430 /DNA_ID=CAMNT_0043229513 /DNA_START=37 /DNA_END=1326 /DNA_ORIENTATION=+
MRMSKTVLVCGTQGCGKTSLIRSFLGLSSEPPIPATIGLDEDCGRIIVDPSLDDGEVTASTKTGTTPPCRALAISEIPAELRVMLPAEGLELEILEIGGGRGGHLRSLPRGKNIDGLLLCYDTVNKSSFRQTAHFQMLHSTQKHFAQGGAASAAPSDASTAPCKLATVLVGLSVNTPVIDPERSQEADAFSVSGGIRHSAFASVGTKEGVQEVMLALITAVLEAEEEAEVERRLALPSAFPAEAWSLQDYRSSKEVNFVMTSPPGERPFEPKEICAEKMEPSSAKRVVEVFDERGIPYGVKPLATCLANGLLHRAVHVWFCDPSTGGLLIRRYSRWARKLASQWGPSCCGEVLCYSSDAKGLRPAESCAEAADRSLREQFGLSSRFSLEFWFSARSRGSDAQELIDVFIASFPDTPVPSLKLERDEEVEW